MKSAEEDDKDTRTIITEVAESFGLPAIKGEVIAYDQDSG
jgi:hypothetical protein